MGEEEELIAALQKWSTELRKPIPEPQLSTLWEAKVSELSSKKRKVVDIPAVRLSSYDSVLTDNASRIESEIVLACTEISKQFSKGSRLKELKTFRLAVCFDDMRRMKERCVTEGMRIINIYLPEDSMTRSLIDLDAISSGLESRLLETYMKKELPCFQDLNNAVNIELKQSEERLRDIINADPDLLLHIGRALQSAYDQCSVQVLEHLTMTFGTIPMILQVSLTSKIHENCAKFLLGSLLPGFKRVLKEELWNKEITVRYKQLFHPECCLLEDKLVIAATVSRLGQSEQTVSDILLHLEVSAVPEMDLDLALEQFQARLTVQRKCCVLLSLCLILSGVYYSLPKPGGEFNFVTCYHATKRNFFRSVVNRLFGSGTTPLFNDWLLARCAEEVVAELQGLMLPESSPELMTQGVEVSSVDIGLKNSSFQEAANFAKSVYRRTTSKLLVLPTQGLEERSVSTFEIEELTDPPALHTTLAISGWLSQQDDLKTEWQNLWKFPGQSKVLALRWDAGSAKKTVIKAAYHLLAFVFPLVGFLNLLRNHPFRDASFQADATGKTLAGAIRTRVFGKGTLSLVGFSLGARVIFSCLEDLARDDQVYIQDVILLGGAAPSDPTAWVNRRKAVCGRLVNVYSLRDRVLSIIYRVAKLHQPIGNCPIEAGYAVENFDASGYIAEHQDHRKLLDQSLALINYQP